MSHQLCHLDDVPRLIHCPPRTGRSGRIRELQQTCRRAGMGRHQNAPPVAPCSLLLCRRDVDDKRVCWVGGRVDIDGNEGRGLKVNVSGRCSGDRGTMSSGKAAGRRVFKKQLKKAEIQALLFSTLVSIGPSV